MEFSKLYHKLFDNLLDGFAHCEMHFSDGKPADFTYLAVNKKFEELTGLKDVVGKRVSEVIPGIRETNPDLLEKYGRAAETGSTECFETYLPGLDIWFRISAYGIEKHQFVAVFENISQQKKNENNIKQLVSDLQKAQIYARMGSWSWNIKSNTVKWSDGMYNVFGVKKENFTGDLSEIIENSIYPDDREKVHESNRNVTKNGKPDAIEYRIIRQDNSVRTVWAEAGELSLDKKGDPNILSGYVIDITERKHIEFERDTTIKFLTIINESNNIIELIEKITMFIQSATECEAVGIRLKKGDDYPYYETRGFSNEFVLSENSLYSYDENGLILTDAGFNPIIECMCGNVICGRFDSTKDFFSSYGSFYTNSTSKLLKSTTEEDRQARTRNRCNGEGYESVALIPLISDKQRIGLLQLNDRRENMFTIELVNMWERLAGYLAVAVKKFQAQQDLKDNLKEKETLLAEIHHRVKNNLQIVSALLNLQKKSVNNPEFSNLLNDSCTRIHSMALIHEILYRSNDFRKISLREYIESLSKHINIEYRITSNPVNVITDVENHYLSINNMIPLGLIINELMTNSLKYAFNSVESPLITVSIKQSSESKLLLIYSDNGCGFDFNSKISGHTSLGLDLIINLSNQIGENGHFEMPDGMKFISEINF